MATKMSDKLSIREGLIKVVSAERFQLNKPRSGGNMHVVVMEKTGDTLRHYCTLRSDKDALSIGERVWGNFVCYVVDLNSRELRIEEECPTQDRITNVRVVADIIYRAVDGERVAIGVEDALRSLREDSVTLLRREVVRVPLNRVTEEHLETHLHQASTRFQSRLGIAIERVRVRVDWPEEVLARRRAALEQKLAQRAEAAKRRGEWELEEQVRHREKRLEMEDIEHIDQLVQRLGLQGMPADLRLRLHALPREEALNQIIAAIEEQRKYVRGALDRRMQEEYALLRKLIDDGVLEDMDLVDFGRSLLDRYQHSLAFEEAFGASSGFLFGDIQRPQLDSETTGREEEPSGGTDETPRAEVKREDRAEQSPDSAGESSTKGTEVKPDATGDNSDSYD